MSNIYEALEQAQREKATAENAQPLPHPPESITKTSFVSAKRDEKAFARSSAREMLSLYQNIENLLPNLPQKTIQFIGSQQGEGVSTIVREFAKMVAMRLGRTALILDAAHHNPTQHMHFNIIQGQGWADALGNGACVENACHQAGDAKLYVSPMSRQYMMMPKISDRSVDASFLDELKNRFDFILVDSSPATTSPDSLAITRFVDGVVLVLEADRTRRPVVQFAMDSIVKNGGNVLGVVFNKRRYYIPEFIYKRL